MKTYISIFISLQFLICFFSYADDPNRELFGGGRKVKMGTAHSILPIVAKGTNGILSTVAGASMFIVMPIEDKNKDRKVKLKLRYFEKGEQAQWVFGRPVPVSFVSADNAYSWGLFQVNRFANKAGTYEAYRDLMAHELGHGVAVDMMGPLIIPIGIGDYANSGTLDPHSPHYNNSFLEQAADLEAHQDEMVNRKYHLGVSLSDLAVPGVYFYIEDFKSYREEKNPKTLKQAKRFRFLSSNLNIEDCDCDLSMVTSGEFSLANYESSLLIGDNVKLSIKGIYKALNYKRDKQADSRVDLYQGQNLVGISVPLSDSVNWDAKGGVSIKSSAYFDDRNFHLIDAYAGLTAETSLSVKDFLRVHGHYSHHWGIQSETSTYGGSITSEIPLNDSMGINISLNGEKETISPDKGKPIEIDHLRLNIGASF